MAALQYVDIPNYSALILRRTYADLALPGAIMDRAGEWLRPSAARWREKDKQWIFPSGARLTFGYLEAEVDKFRYQGSEYQTICFDELTQFSETQYTYLMSRLRRLNDMQVPIRTRAASNPGGAGHDWVKARFYDPATRGDRVFVPAKLDDNPSLDKAEYIKTLDRLDDLTRRQLRDGEWIRSSGGLIYPLTEHNLVQAAPVGNMHYLLATDLGSSLQKPTTAFTVNGYAPHLPYVYAIESHQMALGAPGDVAQVMHDYAKRYDFDTMVVDEGGLGSGYIREFQTRYGLPVEPAKNRDKRGYRKLLRGDIERGIYKVVVPTNKALIAECGRLEWNLAGTDAEKGAMDHATDSALYGYVHSYHYLHQDDRAPAPGSVEAIEAEAEAMLIGDEVDDDDEDDLNLIAHAHRLRR